MMDGSIASLMQPLHTDERGEPVLFLQMKLPYPARDARGRKRSGFSTVSFVEPRDAGDGGMSVTFVFGP